MATFEKFGNNAYGITNEDGKMITMDYIRRYIHCWCRVSNGFVHERKANIAHFMSPENLEAHRGMTGSRVGHDAALSTRWDVETDAKGRVVRILEVRPIRTNSADDRRIVAERIEKIRKLLEKKVAVK
jgi:hypothetical protein